MKPIVHRIPSEVQTFLGESNLGNNFEQILNAFASASKCKVEFAPKLSVDPYDGFTFVSVDVVFLDATNAMSELRRCKREFFARFGGEITDKIGFMLKAEIVD